MSRQRLILSGVGFLLLACALASRPLLSAAGVMVSGTVSGSDRGFMSGASVVIEATPRRETRTDADGRFSLPDIPSGSHRFLVTAEGYLHVDRTIDVGSAPVSVDIVLLKLPGLP